MEIIKDSNDVNRASLDLANKVKEQRALALLSVNVDILEKKEEEEEEEKKV